MGRKEILTDQQKLKFIEILLIVGAILSAFNLPIEMVWIFMLFILVSLLYYLYLQREDKNIRTFNMFAEFVALFFSGIFTYLFGVSVMTVTINYYPYTISIPIIYYIALTWVFYKVLSKPLEGDDKNMWDKIKNNKWLCFIFGSIFIISGASLATYGYYLLFSSGQISGSDYLAIGLALFSSGIALIALCISRGSTTKINRLTQSDYDNFVDNLENERLTFIGFIDRKEEITHYKIEVLAWKSFQYFERAISLIEWVDKSRFPRLSNLVNNFASIILPIGKKLGYDKRVFNRDVENVVRMYTKLWDTGIIKFAKPKVRNSLVTIFEDFIGDRLKGEEDSELFNRVLTTIKKKDENETFKKIVNEKKPITK